MSNTARDWARSLPLSSHSEKSVLKELGDRANQQNECHPGLEQLAFDTALSTRTVTAALKGLEEKGLISRRRRYRGYQNRISGDIYVVHVGNSVDDERKPKKPRGKPRAAAPAEIEAASEVAEFATHDDGEAAASANFATHEASPSDANDVANFATHEVPSVANVAAAEANFAPALTVEPSVNPQSSSVPEVPQERAAQFDGEIDEDLYLGLGRPDHDDDDDFGIDEVTSRVLRGLDERINPIVLVGRLRADGVDTGRLNLLRASTEVWSRHKGRIADPIAYLAKAIEADCTNPDWALARPGRGPVSTSGGAVTADKICEAHGHTFVGTYDEICGRCGEERPGWRDDRDAQTAREDALAAEGARTR
jgi:Helix-turn-helix domain